MKKTIFIFFSVLLLVFVLSFSHLAQAEFKKTKIAILDFQLQGQGYETTDMGKIVAEWLVTALVKEGRFDIIERRLLEKVVEEQKLGISGLVDEKSASQLGKILGAKIIISGTVMRFQNIMEVNARIIDVESTSIIAAESIKDTNAIRLEDLVVQMAEKIIKDFPLEGYVVNREGDKILIDLGKRAGAKVGMQFIVYKEGDVIKHPKTGEVLDIKTIETGLVEVKEIRDNTAEAVILKEDTPEVIAYGQMVKNVVEPRTPVGKYTVPPITPSSPSLTPFSTDKPDLAQVSSMLDEAQRLKDTRIPKWENKVKEALITLKPIYGQYRTSPDVYLTYARAFYILDSFRKTNKFLEKALYFDHNYVDALVFKGDIYYNLELGKNKSSKNKSASIAIEAYETAANTTTDTNLKAMMYSKIGNVYADLLGNNEKAKEYWQKAITTAPESEGGKLAKGKLPS